MSAEHTADWLCEMIGTDNAEKEGTDYVLRRPDPGQFAIVSLEEQKVYLVTVQEAQFVPCGDEQKGKP